MASAEQLQIRLLEGGRDHIISDKTQFIVITHRRGTMEAADILYGVTMQEKGVSRMLAINMNDMAEELNIN